MPLLYATFPTLNAVERAIGALQDHGVHGDDISVIASEKRTPQELDAIERAGKSGVTTTTGADAAHGAAIGAGAGAVVGALGALASLLIPGFGLVFGGGAAAIALGTAIGTAAGGAVAGGVVGFLSDQGMPEPVAQKYADAVKQGGAVLAVELPSGRCDFPIAQGVMAKYGGGDFQRADADLVEDEEPRAFGRLPGGVIELEERRQEVAVAARARFTAVREEPGDADQPDLAFRRDFARLYPNRELAYEDALGCYRHGYALRQSPRLRGRSWEEVEAEARAAWRERHPARAWERDRAAVRYGYERRI